MSNSGIIAIRLDDDYLERLAALCDAAQVDRSTMIRMLIDAAAKAQPATVSLGAPIKASNGCKDDVTLGRR